VDSDHLMVRISGLVPSMGEVMKYFSHAEMDRDTLTIGLNNDSDSTSLQASDSYNSLSHISTFSTSGKDLYLCP
jgi:hypothetical protein